MTLKKFSRQRNIRIFNIFREENTRVCFFCFTCIFTRIRMIQSRLALVHCGLHPTYLSKVGSAVPISTIIIHHHFCQSWRASVNEVQKVVLVDNYISPHRIRCCANFSLYLTLTLSYCFLFPSFTFSIYLFSFSFSFRNRHHQSPAPSKYVQKRLRQGLYRVLYHTSHYNMHNVFLHFSAARLYHFFDN